MICENSDYAKTVVYIIHPFIMFIQFCTYYTKEIIFYWNNKKKLYVAFLFVLDGDCTLS